MRPTASFHCAPVSFNTRPVNRAATNTPVPDADNQLMVKRATSGFAPGGATGGMRCTKPWSAGMSQTGRESEPPKFEPNSVVVNETPENKLFR